MPRTFASRRSRRAVPHVMRAGPTARRRLRCETAVPARSLVEKRRDFHMGFAAYMVGMVLVVLGLAYGAHLIGVAERWIAVGIIVLLGLGVVGGITKTRRRDPS